MNTDKEKKKVLIFSLTYYPDYVGGAEVAIKEITDRTDPNDIEFHMVTLRFNSMLPRVEKVGNVLVHRIGLAVKGTDISRTYHALYYLVKILYVPLAAIKAIRLHRINTFDGIWAMMAYMLFPTVLMRFVGVRIPYALTLQEGDPFEHVFSRWHIALFRPLLSIGFKNASVVQTISTFLATWARKAGFKGFLEVIPNAVNTKHFSQVYSKEELEKAQQELGKKKGDMFMVTTGRLVKKNAIDDVIRAMALLPEQVHFVVFGVGPDEEMLKALARKEDVEGRVHFRGHIDHSVMPLYLKACDIFIRPSRSEGMGISFIEAMAAGLPVIATQVGGIADFLFDEKRNPEKPTTGWVVEKDSPKQIAEAVRDILAQPEKVAKVKKTARALAFEKYDWDIIARDMRKRVFARTLSKQ